MTFRFEELIIWQEARAFTFEIYKTTSTFPKSEIFSLTDQLKRAAASIAANIAEGSASTSKKDFIHYLDIARKSLFEVVSHLYIAEDQKYITNKQRE